MEYDVYRLKISEDGDTGMKAMSLVDDPAIQSDFLKFSKEKDTVVVALKNEEGEYKQIVAGLALIPNKMIYRKNGDYEYFVFFEAEDIEAIRNKFHKEKLTDVVNLQHSDEKVNSYLIESYILNTQERVDEVKAQGIDEAILGSWYVQYKIEDSDAWEQALENDINGFSIEIKGDLVQVELNKNNFTNKNNRFMAKFNELINKFKQVLMEFEEVTANIADTDRVVIYTETGEPVYEVITEEGVGETKEVMGEGEYILDSGVTIVVDENGNLSEIKEDEAAEPINDDELGKEAKLEEDEEEKPEDEKEENLEENPEDEEEDEKENPVMSLIPKNEDGGITDGSYSVEVYVENGKVSYGALYAYTYKDLEFAKQQAEDLKTQVEELKKEPAAEPLKMRIIKEQSGVQKLSKEEKRKMNNLELTLKKLNIE